MGIFKSKNDLSGAGDTPIDQVSAMKNQGYSNNQIIQTLQRDGYTSSQIFDAMSQFELASKNISPATASSSFDQQMNPQFQPNLQPQPQMMQPMQPMQMQPTSSQQMQTQMPQFSSMEGQGPSTEEIVEAMIDEKWNELVKDINKVIEWKQKADSRLTVMEQQLSDMKDQFDKLHQAIIGKVGDYDKHILDVHAELQAMEKVFSKVLPSFVDNVNELTRITDKMKDSESIQRKSKPLPKQKSSDDF